MKIKKKKTKPKPTSYEESRLNKTLDEFVEDDNGCRK